MIEINNDDIKTILHDISNKYILPKFNNLNKFDIMKKNNNTLVTSVDIEVENKLKTFLKKLLSSSLFIGEESSEHDPSMLLNYNHNDYCWTVDPIDGTKNFIKGKDKFAIMLALSFKSKILQSWIYKPIEDEFCYSINGGGVFVNNVKIESNSTINVERSNGSISTKYWNDNYINKFEKIKNRFNHVSSYGCMGYEYVDIAKGKRDFAVISKLSPWDHIPGILIIRESGAYDEYLDGGSYDFISNKKNLIVASNIILAKKILFLIKE